MSNKRLCGQTWMFSNAADAPLENRMTGLEIIRKMVAQRLAQRAIITGESIDWDSASARTREDAVECARKYYTRIIERMYPDDLMAEFVKVLTSRVPGTLDDIAVVIVRKEVLRRMWETRSTTPRWG